MTGRLIAFEGGEATGKSTQARLLAEQLGARLMQPSLLDATATRLSGARLMSSSRLDATDDCLSVERSGARLTYEPGATELGARIRSMVLDTAGPSPAPRAEALLMAADRAQHVAEVIRPALDAGAHVVTDRFIGSSLAYQGFGRGLGINEILALSRFATDGLRADLNLLLRVPEGVARARRGSRADRIEAEAVDFHCRVFEGYLTLAEQDPERWVMIDGDRPVDEVAESVRTVVRERLGV